MRKILPRVALTLGLTPAVAAAAASTFSEVAYGIVNFLNNLIPFLIAIGLFAFLFGVLRFLIAQENEEIKERARESMVWGTLALFIMVSFWGIVQILLRTFFP